MDDTQSVSGRYYTPTAQKYYIPTAQAILQGKRTPLHRYSVSNSLAFQREKENPLPSHPLQIGKQKQ